MIRKIPFKLLKAIKNNQQNILSPSFAKMCLKVCASFTANKMLKKFIESNLVRTERIGRKLKVKLTEKGELVLKSLEVVDLSTKI